jgi:hypothetical protein
MLLGELADAIADPMVPGLQVRLAVGDVLGDLLAPDLGVGAVGDTGRRRADGAKREEGCGCGNADLACEG